MSLQSHLLMLFPSSYHYQKILQVSKHAYNSDFSIICYIEEIFGKDKGIDFTKITPDGSEWFLNDHPAIRNFTRLAKLNEVYTKAIFLHQNSPLKSIKNTETIGTDAVYAEIDLEKITFSQTVPAQVNTFQNEKDCYR